MRIYTRSGDDGTTCLANDKKIKKNSVIIELLGCLDELNSFLGFAAEALCSNESYSDLLRKIYLIQKELLDSGAQLSSGNKITQNPHKTTRLEDEIDAMNAVLPAAKSFILPGGGECASRLHIARAVCRRAERVAYATAADFDKSAMQVGVYLNRLSDWLFTAARLSAFIAGVEEMTW